MRITVTGATGNLGTSLLDALAADPRVDSVVGLARRRPERNVPKVTWAQADVGGDDLEAHFRGADAVAHLAWAIQGTRDPEANHRTNVVGSVRVLQAAAAADVPALVFASSVATYSPGPKDPPVDESWPTHGIPGSIYAQQKSYVERLLDGLERARPQMRVVRLRPSLVVRREAAAGVRHLFLGPFVPSILLRHRAVPLIPDVPDLRFQVVHSDDVAEAFRLALTRDTARGAYNVAAGPVLGPPELGRIVGGRLVPVPARLLRSAVGLGWRLHLHPSDPGWVDVVLRSPALDAGRLQRELGWVPTRSSAASLDEVVDGLGRGEELDTPPLAAR